MNFDSKISITGEQLFRVYASSFWIPPVTDNVTLKYSGDGLNWLSWGESITPNEAVYVKGFDSGLYFKLEGNTATLEISY